MRRLATATVLLLGACRSKAKPVEPPRDSESPALDSSATPSHRTTLLATPISAGRIEGATVVAARERGGSHGFSPPILTMPQPIHAYRCWSPCPTTRSSSLPRAISVSCRASTSRVDRGEFSTESRGPAMRLFPSPIDRGGRRGLRVARRNSLARARGLGLEGTATSPRRGGGRRSPGATVSFAVGDHIGLRRAPRVLGEQRRGAGADRGLVPR